MRRGAMKTAVAFIIFRRPDTTRRVFERIRQARPPRLYVIADGPRPEKVGEAEQVAAARMVVEQVDWPCQVTKIYSDTNLGCRDRVVSGLDAVFAEEAQAIILEDDCLPHTDFFYFCEALLERFSGDNQVRHISGNNFLFKLAKVDGPYYFSRYPHIWGWATWASAWSKFDREKMAWRTPESRNRVLKSLEDDKESANFWSELFFSMCDGKSKYSSWGYLWCLTCFSKNWLCVNPRVNLVQNLGDDLSATHTSGGLVHTNIKARTLRNLTRCPPVERHQKADREVFKIVFLQREIRWYRRLLSKLRITLGYWRKQVFSRISK